MRKSWLGMRAIPAGVGGERENLKRRSVVSAAKIERRDELYGVGAQQVLCSLGSAAPDLGLVVLPIANHPSMLERS